MNKLIKLQMRNLFHNKLLYVCLGLALLLYPILDFIMAKTMSSLLNIAPMKVFPEIVSFITSEPGIISVMFIAIFACLDFNEGTTKNIIARGYTRNELLISKYIVTLLGLLIIQVSVFLVFLILFASNGFGYEPDMLNKIIVGLFSIVANTLFYSTLSFVLEKNSSAILACLFVPRIFSAILSLIETKTKLSISDYWIEGILSSFLEKPTVGNMLLPIILFIVYSLLFAFIGTKIMNKREIK